MSTRAKPIVTALFVVGFGGAAVVGGLAGAGVLNGAPEQPGTQQNLVLGQLVQAKLDEEVGRMSTASSPGLIPAAQTNAGVWLGEIVDVVVRCRYGRGLDLKHNRRELDITLKDGTVLRDVVVTGRCSYRNEPPLVMRVRFMNGRVADALTDGRERNGSVDEVGGVVARVAETIVRADWQRSRARYFPPAAPTKTQADFDREWATK